MGDVLGSIGGQIIERVFDSEDEREEKPKEEEPPPFVSKETDPDRLKPWGARRGLFHQPVVAAYAHGGYAPPEMIGKKVRFAELEPEVAITEDGQVQLLDKQARGFQAVGCHHPSVEG